jgi:hypothetical protein
MASNNPYYVEPANPLQALMLGVQGYDRGQKGLNDQQVKAGRMEAMQALQSGDPKATQSALARLIGAGDIPGAKAIADFHQNSVAAQGVFGTPIYGTLPDGSTGIGTFNKQGTFQQIQTPGFSPTPGIKTVDTGTGTAIINSRSGAPVAPGQMQPGAQPIAPQGGPPQPVQGARPQPSGYIAKDNFGEARDKKHGTEVGERLSELGAAKLRVESLSNQMDRMSSTAKRIRDNPALERITGVMGVVPNWPGGKAADVEAELKVLKSQIAYNVLQNMREMSKTGGAVGNVSNYETEQLQNNLAAVEKLQSAGKFKEAMNLLVDYAEGAKKRMRAAYQEDYANLRRPPQATPQAGGSMVPGGGQIIGGGVADPLGIR